MLQLSLAATSMTSATKSVIHSLRIFFIAESRSEIRYF